MKRNAHVLLAALVLQVLAGCSPPVERAYYTLRYPAPAAKFAKPHPITIRVKDLDVRESYDRSELALRDDLVELRYHSGKRWSESPHKMISDVLRDHLSRSGLVEQVVAEIGQTPPDFTLTGEVIAIEQLRTPEGFSARLAMDLRLVRFKDEVTVWTFSFDDRRPAGDGLTRTTVRTQREILAARLDEAFAALDRHLNGEPPPVVAEAVVVAPTADRVLPDAQSPYNALPQVANDPTLIPVGQGAVLVPAYTSGDQEPAITVLQDGRVVAEGLHGSRIPLVPGDYDVRFGSGTVSQQVRIPFRVAEGRTTVVPPTWAGLVVDVVNENFVPFRGAYELIRMDDREEYGLGLGADRLQGEQLRSWVLPSGLYKLIRSGGTYRDRTDFATVRLTEGKLARFVLVADEATGEFRGAGEADPEDLDKEEKQWQLAGVLGGAANFDRSEEVGKQTGWTLGVTLFFDTSASFHQDAHEWSNRLELEEELSRPQNGEFTNEKDRLFLHSIYTYRLIPWFGPYVRAGMESKLFDRYQVFEEKADVEEVDKRGNLVRTYTGVTRVRLASTLAPLELLQGAGGNFRVLRNRTIELDLRLGLGARQTVANGLLILEDKNGVKRLLPADDAFPFGPETTVVGIARITRWVTLTSEFEGLLPISDDEPLFEWRNQASLRLASFASINYRFNASLNPNVDVEDTVRTEHDLQLRFSYTLF